MARADDEIPEGHLLDDDDHALLAKLRALPADGEEPDWRALEAQIRAQVAPLAMPSPWWRNWRWLVPIGALATTVAIVVVLASHPHDGSDVAATDQRARHDASVATEPAPSRPTAQDDHDTVRAPAMWLDGEAVELGDVSDENLDTALSLDGLLDENIDEELPLDLLDERGPGASTGDGNDERLDDAHETVGDMLPDDRWIDALDDDAADRLEQFLARKRT